MKAIMMSVVALLALAAGAASPQERAKKVNEALSKNIAWFFVRPSYNPGYTKIWPLKALAGSVGYTFKVRSDGVVAVVGGKEYNTK